MSNIPILSTKELLDMIDKMEDMEFDAGQPPSRPMVFARVPEANPLNALRAKIARFLHTIDGVSHEDIIGNEAAHTALREALEAHKHAKLYAHYNMKPCAGILLWGPPGCGKTMFGKLAGQIIREQAQGATEICIINATELESKWVGETEEFIRNIFAYAREFKKKHGVPLVVFVDEADAVLADRQASGSHFHQGNVATFLSMMDGAQGENGAFVILATNRSEMIDEAVLRDGRIDRKIRIERPSYEGAKDILFRALTNLPLQTGYHPGHVIDYLVSPEHVIIAIPRQRSDGHFDHVNLTLAHILSGALVVGLVNRAKGIAFRRDLEERSLTGISLADFKLAVDEVLRENRGLNHNFAVQELVEALNKQTVMARAN